MKKASQRPRSGRTGSHGRDGSVYLHMGGKIATMVEVNCETDFVAKTDQFQAFAKDVAMQVTAANPTYVKREDVPEEVKEKEKEIYRNQAKESGKPDKILDKIAEGKLEKFYQEFCLLEQPFIKNPDVTVKGLLDGLISKMGENILVRRFVRFQLGRDDGKLGWSKEDTPEALRRSPHGKGGLRHRP